MSPMLLNVLSVVIAAASLVVSALAFWRLVLLDKSGKFQQLADTIDKVDDARAIDERRLGERLSHVEGAIKHIPTASQTDALRHELAMAEAAIASLDARLLGLNEILKSHENRLMQFFENALARGNNNSRRGS